MKKSLLALSLFALTIVVGIYCSNNHNMNLLLNEKMAPSDHFAWVRALPGKFFDGDAYLKSIRLASKQNITRGNAIAVNWIAEGPGNFGGRITTIAIDPTDTLTIYAGVSSGGIFKTSNGGTTWSAIFDQEAALSIGYICIDPKDRFKIWVGTGDPDIPGSSQIGDGIYLSRNGGATWKNMGLNKTGIITKIAIDPIDTNIIYAATMGVPSLQNNNRGLYKTINGGVTWSNVLFLGNDAGVSDLIVDYQNPSILYASGWNRTRTNQQSNVTGTAAKIYKSTNAGQSWDTLNTGLPARGCKIGLAMSKQNPQKLYAQFIDETYEPVAFLSTTNGGATWVQKSVLGLNGTFGGFGWYFGEIEVSPVNDNILYACGVTLSKSTDGGNSWFNPSMTNQTHADKHAIAFTSGNAFILGTDGGLYKTLDGGNNFTDIEDLNITQFYRVTSNPFSANVIAAGAQDNGSMFGNRFGFNTWTTLFGGDGFQVIYDPTNPDVIYSEWQNGGIVVSTDGGIQWYSATTGIDPSDRLNWDMQYIMSPFNSQTLYTGTYRVYKNISGANTNWFTISPDLTDGIVFGPRYHVINTLSQSKLDSNLLYVGTSDGNVWYTPDDGTNWNKVINGLPKRYVSAIKASDINKNTVFVTFQGYKYNDSIPYIFKSNDNGNTWISIAGDLPMVGINDVLPVLGNDNYIFVGTDIGVYITTNGGTNWSRVGTNMPLIPVLDLEYSSRDRLLIAGTYARGAQTANIDSIIALSTSSTYIVAHNNINIYPNPSNSFFKINGLEGNFDLAIYNAQGQMIKNLKNQNQAIPVNIYNLKPGLYFVAINQRDAKQVVKKLLIN